MILYRVDYYDDDGARFRWVARKSEAQTERDRIAAIPEVHSVEQPKRVSVPTTRAKLVAWLNTHVSTNNG